MVGAITALVGTEGHQVITAYDGLTAVRRYREERPDIVLLDLAMPGPDGFTVAGQIRAEGDAPIVVVSGESSEEAKVRALGIGADDYLVKPFGRAELLARIAAVMRRAERSAGRHRRRPRATPAARRSEAGALTLDLGRHEARVGEHAPRPDPDRVPPRRGARPRERRPRPPPPPRPRRLARRGRPGPALAQAPRRPPPPQGRGRRRPGDPRASAASATASSPGAPASSRRSPRAPSPSA